ncbi:MAG: phosphoglycolate phosphatase [Candidatus Thalassarchaeaceae archaeon]|nr:phosphoglycolate phosphatase [Candidatus Thalassarchaeaceae archaeon]
MVAVPNLGDWDMIVFDVDGTLLDEEGFHDELVNLARRVDREVMPVSLASGRTLPNVTPIMQSIGASGFIVAENGGMVWDSKEGHEILSLSDGARAKDAAEWLATKINGLDPKGIESNRWRETEWCLSETDSFELMRKLIADSEWSDLEVVSTGYAVHIASPGLNKSHGLRIALQQRGISPDRVIACGDAPNDLPMFDLVGFSVAVSERFPNVVESADYITKEKGKNGSIELLKELLG